MNINVRIPRTVVALVAAIVLVIGGVAVAGAVGDGGNPPEPAGDTARPPTQLGALPGGQTENYTGIKPCRILDTRTTTPLVDAARSFKVSGDLTAQGGSASCGIPEWASSVSINLTGISTGSTGFVRGWAAGDTPANATLLNFGTQINVSNQVNLPLCRGTSCTSGFTLRAFGSTHIVGDAVGYYSTPLYAYVTAAGQKGQTSGVSKVIRLAQGQYKITFDRPVKQCALSSDDLVFVNVREVSAEANGIPENEVNVRVLDAAGNPADTYFWLVAIC